MDLLLPRRVSHFHILILCVFLSLQAFPEQVNMLPDVSTEFNVL